MTRSFLALSISLLLAPLPLASTPAHAAKVGAWTIAYWEGSGGYDGCQMKASYKSGIRFSIGVTANYAWGIILAHDNWSLQKEQKMPMALEINGVPIGQSTAVAADKHTLILPLQKVDTFKALQRGSTLTITSGSNRFTFDLDDTGRAMDKLLECVKVQKDRGDATTAAAKPAPTKPAAGSSSATLLTQSESTIVLTNLLNGAGVRGYKLLPPRADDKGVYVRYDDGSSGYFIASRGQGTAGADEFASDVVNTISKGCKGDFASGKQVVPSTDGSVIRRMLTTCRSGGQVVSMESTVVRKANGFLFLLSRTEGGAQSSGGLSEQATQQQAGIIDAAMRLDDLR